MELQSFPPLQTSMLHLLSPRLHMLS
ncbi:Protein of unknown function [Pyronema omphalodes CBS 100304]|uniref:Uncharacterized protein n=1 Tax=Pyronema omphalodes (strain CBS 100304) TaxID=1076935 RepID=U4L2W6_PYROM|nr:Protein of unknown function [Pyronema omphalodes CBS 100304]